MMMISPTSMNYENQFFTPQLSPFYSDPNYTPTKSPYRGSLFADVLPFCKRRILHCDRYISNCGDRNDALASCMRDKAYDKQLNSHTEIRETPTKDRSTESSGSSQQTTIGVPLVGHTLFVDEKPIVELCAAESYSKNIYKSVLNNELLGAKEVSQNVEPRTPTKTNQSPHRILQFSTLSSESPGFCKNSPSTPFTYETQQLLSSPLKSFRKIGKTAYKMLDAPELVDDFYLNVLDWSSNGILAVALDRSLYLWNSANSQVTKLAELGPHEGTYSSVSWCSRNSHILACGTTMARVYIWDTETQKNIIIQKNHTARIASMSWLGNCLTTGSRDYSIIHSDMAAPSRKIVRKLVGHTLEVCGLKWSPGGNMLASGGNDNAVMLWSTHVDKPLARFTDHCAAVKAIAWSPHENGLLATGGGTADRTIKFWNTLSLNLRKSHYTGSQVCNLAWSPFASNQSKHHELISTHGYSKNHIILWDYPTMEKLVTLTGHRSRILYMSMSPCGEDIVTGAGDETLLFWKVFARPRLSPSNVRCELADIQCLR